MDGYHFIQNGKRKKLLYDDSTGKACLKLALVFFAVFFLYMMLTTGVFWQVAPDSMTSEEKMKIFVSLWEILLKNFFMDANTLSFALLFVIGFAFFHSQAKKVGVIVSERGIAFSGFNGLWFPDIRKFYEWNEFVQIRRAAVGEREVVVFIDRYGKSFFLPYGKEEPPPPRFFSLSFSGDWFHLRQPVASPGWFLVAEGHALLLPEVIERFHVPLTPLADAEKKKIPALAWWGPSWNIPIEGKAAHLVFIALAALFLNLVLRASGSWFFLLENWQSKAFILANWLAGGLGFAFAWRCLKREESREAAGILAFSLAASLWFLATPVVSFLPVWFGEARQETFFVPREKLPGFDERQYWRAERDPQHLFFWLEIPKERRQYEPGAKRDFTIRHGPFGLAAMKRDEFRALYQQTGGE
ncbi:MAG: hypothetical protein LBD68_02090 [Zoogloeaceae bacterium]|nr:hypothetical protein [Zoogloeaceae bacterium]